MKGMSKTQQISKAKELKFIEELGKSVYIKPKRSYLLALHFCLKHAIIKKLPSLAAKFFDIHISSRIVEIPFVLQNIDLEKGRIIDVGCCESLLPIELASRGYEVYGVDIREYPLRHPNFHFVRNICQAPFKDETFDIVTAVLTIEHIGLSAYGAPVSPKVTDRRAMEEMRRILKREGNIIATVPFGIKTEVQQYRVYDSDTLNELFSEIEEIEYAIKINGAWTNANLGEAEKVDSSRSCNSVALIVCRKVGKG